MYAASGHELRKDWFGEDGKKGRHRRFSETLRPADEEESGIIAGLPTRTFCMRCRFSLQESAVERQKLPVSKEKSFQRSPGTDNPS